MGVHRIIDMLKRLPSACLRAGSWFASGLSLLGLILLVVVLAFSVGLHQCSKYLRKAARLSRSQCRAYPAQIYHPKRTAPIPVNV